jgi:hypothetical protein
MISCSVAEAKQVRKRAKLQRRTMSAYVLNIVLRSVQLDDCLFTQNGRLAVLTPPFIRREPGPRTVQLIRCSKRESSRIRMAAKRRGATISAYVLHFLRGSWRAADTFPLKPAGQWHGKDEFG